MSIGLFILAFIAVLYLLFPVRRQPVFDGQAQVISLYNDELAELDKALAQQQISEAEYQTLKTELDKKSSLAMLQTKKTTFAYRPTLLLPAVVFVMFVGGTIFYYVKFYSGEVSRWDSFKAAEQGNIIEGLFNPEVVAPFIEKEQFGICFAMQQQALANYPNNSEVLGNLANCFLRSGYMQLAETAATRGLTHQPDNPELNYYYAQSRLLQTGQGDKDMIAALTKTIKANPNHQGALWLMGLISYQQGNYDGADFFFTRLQTLSPNNSSEINQLLAEIKQKNSEAAQTQAPTVSENSVDESTTEPATETAAVVEEGSEESNEQVVVEEPTIQAPITFDINVDIDPLLTENISANAELFVIVKSVQGGLLLAGKYAIGQFPMTLRLSDNAEGIMKMGDISAENAVSVSARISQQGTAMPQSGDLESSSTLASTNQNPIAVSLLINKVVK